NQVYVSTYLFRSLRQGLTNLSGYTSMQQPYLGRVLNNINGRVEAPPQTLSLRMNLGAWGIADIHGNGVPEAFNLGFNLSKLVTQPVSILTAFGDSSPGDLLETVTSPLGAVTSM